MRRPRLLCAVAVFSWSLACVGTREAGPHEDEWGQVLFWQVTGQSSENARCTDAPDFVDALTLPPLPEDSFFMVRIEDGGRTATAMDCTETRAESCVAVPDMVFEIDGNELVYAQPPEVVDADSGCEVALTPLWTMVDDGEIGVLDVAFSFTFDGPAAACSALDAGIAAEGGNDFGLMDCEATLSVDLEFVRAD